MLHSIGKGSTKSPSPCCPRQQHTVESASRGQALQAHSFSPWSSFEALNSYAWLDKAEQRGAHCITLPLRMPTCWSPSKPPVSWQVQGPPSLSDLLIPPL